MTTRWEDCFQYRLMMNGLSSAGHGTSCPSSRSLNGRVCVHVCAHVSVMCVFMCVCACVCILTDEIFTPFMTS